jgi:hypothetical protein
MNEYIVHKITKKRKMSACTNPEILVGFFNHPGNDQRLADGNLWQMNILHCRPHNRETRCFCREGINLIGSLSSITEKAFNRIRRANVTMHHRRKAIIGQQMLLVLERLRMASGYRF